MSRGYNIHARNSPSKDENVHKYSEEDSLEKLVNSLAAGVNTGTDAWLFTGGVVALCLLIGLLTFSPTLVPLAYLGFVALGLPYRVVSFTSRKWTFFLVDFCYFANLACCAFILLRPEDRRLEAAVYALCEGPLAAALIAWQCAWLPGSPDHIISVLVHLLPGLAMYCHRYLAFTRQPSLLATHIGLALLSDTDPWVATTAGGADAGSSQLASMAGRWGRGLAAAAAIARGRVACPAFAATAAMAPAVQGLTTGLSCAAFACAAPDAAAPTDTAPLGLAGTHHLAGIAAAPGVPPGGGVECYVGRAAGPAPPCPAPGWLWLGAAPLAFYLAWQLLYFLVVQVACRRMILAGGYDTSYRSLARRAQRANSPLNRLVRRGSVARRLFMYGVLQLLFTMVTQLMAVATYHSFAAATTWQVVKLLLPLYLGACQQCHRLPAQQLRAAAARLAAAGALSQSEAMRPPRAVDLETAPAGPGPGPVVQAHADSTEPPKG